MGPAVHFHYCIGIHEYAYPPSLHSPASGRLCGFSLCWDYEQGCQEPSLDIALCEGSLEVHSKEWMVCASSTSHATLRNSFVRLGRGGKEAEAASTLGPCKPPEVSENRAMKMENKQHKSSGGLLPLPPFGDPPDGQRGLPHQKILTAFNEYSQGFIKHFPVWLNKTVFKPPSH